MSESASPEPPLEILILPAPLPPPAPPAVPPPAGAVERPIPVLQAPGETWLRIHHVLLLILLGGAVVWIVGRSWARPAVEPAGGSALVPPVARVAPAAPERTPALEPPGEPTGTRSTLPVAGDSGGSGSAKTPRPTFLAVDPGAPQNADLIRAALVPLAGAERPTLEGSFPKEASPAPPLSASAPTPAEAPAAPRASPPEPPPAEPAAPAAPVEREADRLVREAKAAEAEEPPVALALYRKALEADPARTGIWKRVADLELARGAREESARAYREFLRSEPGRVDALQNLGLLEMSLGRPEEARTCLEEALRRAPSADLHYNLGNLHGQSGRLDQAKSAYRRALDYNPAHPEARFNLALVLEREGRPAEALAALAGGGPTADPEFARLRGRLEARVGGAEATEALRKARSSTDVEMVLAVASGFSKADEMEKALALLDHALDLAPETASIRLNHGVALQAMGRLAEAAKDYAEAIRIDPTLGEAELNLGILSEDRGEYVEALRHYAAALRATPRLAPARNNIGVLYLKVGHGEKAAECFRLALESDGRFAPARLNLAWAYLALGQTDRAREELRSYEAEVPREKKDPSAARVLADLEGPRTPAPGSRPAARSAADAAPPGTGPASRDGFDGSLALERLEQARQFMKEGRYEEANQILRLLLTKFPGTPAFEEAKKLTREMADKIAGENEALRRRLGSLGN